MTSADNFVAAARREIGTKESPAGSNKQPYAAIAGHANGQPWCATFIVAMARRVGLHLESESAYTPAMADGFRHAGRFDQNPELGAIAFYDFPDSVHRIQHVGIVTGWTGSTVTTVEGNTSSGASGSQDNGGTVAERTRARSHVVGYGHPVFTDQPAPAPKEKVAPMYNPPLGPIAAVLHVKYPDGSTGPDGNGNPDGPVVAAVSPQGHMFCWGIPWTGNAAGKPDFAGRVAARLRWHSDGGYEIVATSKEPYAYRDGK